MTTYRVCLCFRRKFRPSSDEPPQGIRELFHHYAVGGNLMGPDQLQRFLVEVQREESATRESAQVIIDSARDFRPFNVVVHHKRGLSLEAFFRYLFSPDNSPLVSSVRGVHHDMNAPISHYFIFTGHNSYLTGNQLSSDCSDVPIIKALRNGVKAVELDMWPNSTKDNVNIRHGRTFTTAVELSRCLSSIKEHAFCASPYPVIITLEDHLTPHLQAKAAEMINQTFGDMLFIPDPNSLEELPSPEDLKLRVIISTKPPKEYLEGEQKLAQDDDHDIEKVSDSTHGEWGNELSSFRKWIPIDVEDEQAKSEQHLEGEDSDDEDQKSYHAAPEYRRLIAIPASKKKGGFTKALKVDPKKVTRLSLSEQALEKAIMSHRVDILRFTQRNLLRIYPKGSRIMSSNYNPLIAWMHGAQMVAFNMQGYGRQLWLMHGMFRANGGCGFVKKPDFLLKGGPESEIFNPKTKLRIKTILKVRVYMGDGWRFDFSQTHFDMYSPPDFYTRVGIAGVPDDTVMKKTKVIEDNWTPVWDDEFVFPLRVPELALLRIEVHEYDMSEKDDFGGQACFPVSELKPGIRAVPLCDHKGEKMRSVKLLMHFEFLGE